MLRSGHEGRAEADESLFGSERDGRIDDDGAVALAEIDPQARDGGVLVVALIPERNGGLLMCNEQVHLLPLAGYRRNADAVRNAFERVTADTRILTDGDERNDLDAGRGGRDIGANFGAEAHRRLGE